MVRITLIQEQVLVSWPTQTKMVGLHNVVIISCRGLRSRVGRFLAVAVIFKIMAALDLVP